MQAAKKLSGSIMVPIPIFIPVPIPIPIPIPALSRALMRQTAKMSPKEERPTPTSHHRQEETTAHNSPVPNNRVTSRHELTTHNRLSLACTQKIYKLKRELTCDEPE